ncbi:P-loop containing nucleoside triphosphate hydrolase protein [Mycena galericulata]|nr:P-loop containing nucleoside triphosphate hydrolase protein [Mycena galericulata]
MPIKPFMSSKPKRPVSDWDENGWGSNGNGGWGSPAPQPRPCVCSFDVRKRAPKQNMNDEGQSSDVDSDDGTEDAFDGVVERKDHYLIREQIWYEGLQRWLPYDSSRYDIPVPEQDLGNYFYVNIRHLIPGGNYSLTSYGDEFYDDSPERTADSLLPDIPILQSKLVSIEKYLSGEPAASEAVDKRAFAVSLGCQEAKHASHPESHIDQFLKEAQEHITILSNYLLELYKHKAQKLALQVSDGCIEFSLLVFYFELNQRYCLSPWNINDATGFLLERRAYNQKQNSLNISGSAYVWNGYEYTKISVTHSISSYRGTQSLHSLYCQPLTPDLEAMLVARGRLYTALSGCHYRACQSRQRISSQLSSNSNLDIRNEQIPDFSEEDLWLLPGSVFGFNLTKKMWSVFPVKEVGPVVFDEHAWDHLVLESETKVLIKSLVQVTRNSNTSSDIISDVITGKGGGLICVLHGPPGTGKTLTAEAVAEHLKRPLYVVGTSELSTKPSTLEEKLKSILCLATAWDAVLLIDEADVLLEQRSLHEIERNSLVSVALRVLEYHRGVLFLTTNRLKTFDVAFLSRFSIAIKYPEHDLHSRRVIWRKFFELAGVKTQDTDGSGRSTPTDMVKLDDPAKVAVISEAELDELAEKPFNGRTIKNLVRTAQALALSSDEPMSKAHVDIVVRSQEKFLREFATA